MPETPKGWYFEITTQIEEGPELTLPELGNARLRATDSLRSILKISYNGDLKMDAELHRWNLYGGDPPFILDMGKALERLNAYDQLIEEWAIGEQQHGIRPAAWLMLSALKRIKADNS